VVVLVLAAAIAGANAQQKAQHEAGPPAQALASVPANGVTVTEWYKKNVYDPSDNKIGEIKDVLVDHQGKAQALIIAVGGFLGAGQKDVAVPFDAVRMTTNKSYLVMNTTKDAMKSAKGFKYDKSKMTWIPEEASTTGSRNNNR
jgi:sporulation protein YlmC with PRC-barrel domain